MRISTRIQSLLVSAALLVPLVAMPVTAAYAQPTEEKTAASWSGVVINEAYLSGGSKGAAYKNKFIELYNTTDNDVTLDGTSLQYRPASGTGASNAAADLTGVIKAKGHYLIKAGSNGSDGAELPQADATATSLNASGTKGTLFLAATTSKLSPAVGDTTANADIIDALGYGDTNTFEKAAATAPTNNTAVKSLNRVPTPITTSASRAMMFAPSVPVTPTAPKFSGWLYGSAPFPAIVSPTGMPVRSTKCRSASYASL